MTKKEFEKIGKALLPGLPGFAAKGPLLCRRPIGHTLRGIYFARSIEPRGFYAHLFVQPLFVPAEHITFNFGWRLGGGSHLWEADSPGMLPQLVRTVQSDVLPYLSRIESVRDVADAAKGLHASADRYIQQVIAYSLAYVGDVDEAVAALRDFTRQLDVANPWLLEMATRATNLESLLLTDVQSAKRQLESWEAESARNLKLEEFRGVVSNS